jgi:predicted dithiol-disulfide oxidoreductase (DUF899 family)
MPTQNAPTQNETAAGTLHSKGFPDESAEYRSARDTLLRHEMELRRHIEDVAAERRNLPLGGRVKEDYVFEGADGPVRLSELFADRKDTLLVYSYMYGPQMAAPCVMCTSILDALDGEAPHVMQRVNFAVVARSPIARILEFTRARGWRNLRLLSSAGNTYNIDYHGETAKGAQQPMMNVFVRRDGAIHHTYGTELLFAPSEPGQDSRHVDLIWPLWNLFDLTPEGRGTDWYPRLKY